MTGVALRYDEAARLAAFLTRLCRWQPDAAVRLQVRGEAIGVLGSTPMDALALLALPLAEPADGDAIGADRVVAAAPLVAAIGDVSSPWPELVRPVALPEPVGPRAPLAVLPPRSGWHAGETSLAGDVVPLVAAAVERFRSRAGAEPDASPSRLSEIAAEVWAAPGWGGIPLPALHAARLLGMLAHDGYRISTATAPGWKRLSTPGGQVLVRSGGVPALSLTVVR